MAHHPDPSNQFVPTSRSYARGKFGRLFPWLPPCLEDTPKIRAELRTLARNMRGAETNDSGRFVVNQQSQNPAGYTYLGQFIAHDLSFDPTSISERQFDPEFLWNFRTPALDLDSIYGGGPSGCPQFYRKDHFRTHFLVGERKIDDLGVPDLPRTSDGTAIISDPRNDENFIISELHTAFLLFHNKMVDNPRTKVNPGDSRSGEKIFLEAQQLTRWHFQWVVLFDYLPRIVDLSSTTENQNLKLFPQMVQEEKTKSVAEQIRTLVENEKKRKFYDWRNEPFIPLEFSAAAFRLGHAQVRKQYIFDMKFSSTDLFPRPNTKLDWRLFFPEEGKSANLNHKIRPVISFHLGDVPFASIFQGGNRNLEEMVSLRIREAANPSEVINLVLEQENKVPDINNLAYRNLVRGMLLRLPSGQSVARAMGLEPLTIEEAGYFSDNTPLWYYILHEAFDQNDGERLGAVGSRIVSEVIIGMIQGDKTSFLNQAPNWKPNEEGRYTMIDFLKEAGVYPAGEV